jgi:hypothetical protein
MGLGVFIGSPYDLGDSAGFRLYSGDLTFSRLCGSLRAKIAIRVKVYKTL